MSSLTVTRTHLHIKSMKSVNQFNVRVYTQETKRNQHVEWRVVDNIVLL